MVALRQIQSYLDNRDIKRAENLIAKSLRADPDKEMRASLLLARSRLKLLAQKPDDVLRDVEQAVELLSINPQDRPQIRELIADSLLMRYETALVGFMEKSDLLRAKEHYLEIMGSHPDYENLGWIYYQIGRVSLILTDVEQAETYLRQALFTASHVPELTAYVYERLGFIAFYERRDPIKADMYLTKALDTYPSELPQQWSVQVLLLQTRALRKIDLNRALDTGAEAIELTNSATDKSLHTEALLNQSEILEEYQSRPREVIDILQRFLLHSKNPLGIDVTRSRVYERLANAYMQTHQYIEALDAYHFALQFNPDHPWEHALKYQMAVALFRTGDFEGSRSVILELLNNGEVTSQDRESLLGLLKQIDPASI